MTEFSFHDIESAPEPARELLAGAKKSLGFVPSLYAGLAEAPAALEGYFALSDLFGETSLSPAEQQVVALAASAENGCRFCMAAHSTIARHMVKVDSEVVDALRAQKPIPDERLEALRRYVVATLEARGRVRGKVLEDFLAAGFTRRQALEVVLGVAMKTLSNYANHLLETPVDPAFEAERWEPAR